MQNARPHSGEMSQDTFRGPAHRTRVLGNLGRTDAASPAARHGRHFFQALSASSVGLELGISVVLTLLLGIWLDGKLGTAPWMMLLGLALGLTAGFRGVLRAVHRSDRAAEAERG